MRAATLGCVGGGLLLLVLAGVLALSPQPRERAPQATGPRSTAPASASTQQAISRVARRYYRRVLAGDGRRACQDVSRGFVRRPMRSVLTRNGRAVPMDCEQRVAHRALQYGLIEPFSVSRAAVDGTRARVRIRLRQSRMRSQLLLVRERGRWRVDAERAAR